MYQIFCVPDVKTSLTLSVTLSVILSISLSTTAEQSSKETFLKIWNSVLNTNPKPYYIVQLVLSESHKLPY